MSEQRSTEEYYAEDSKTEIQMELEQDLGKAEQLLDDIENARRLLASIDSEDHTYVAQELIPDLVERAGLGQPGDEPNALLDMLRQHANEEIARLEQQLA